MNLCFFGHNLSTTYTRRPIEGFENADFGLAFEKKQRNCPLNFSSGLDDVIQKSLDPTAHTHITSPNPNFEKTKLGAFLLFSEGWPSSLALSDGRLWLNKVRATVVVLQSLKGYISGTSVLRFSGFQNALCLVNNAKFLHGFMHISARSFYS